jgi:hypothetical protein
MGAVRLLIGFGLAALAAELLLHILPVSTGYGLTGVSAAQPILRGTPHASYVYSKNWNFRLSNAGRLNNYGFRASYDYRPDPRAVLVVGNSYVAADAIVPSRNMTELSGRLLGRPAYAIGVDGFSLADYLVAARWGARTFWPAATGGAHVLLVLLTTGDLNHSCDPRAGEHYLRVGTQGVALALVPRPEPSRLKQWLNDSMLFRYVFDNLRAPANWGRERREGAAQPASRAGAGPAGGCAAPDAAARSTAFLLQSFREFEAANAARVVFVLAPGYRREQNYAAGATRDVDTFAGQADARGFQIVRLQAQFGQALSAGTRLDFMPIDGHWNAAANAIAAAAIADSLRSESGSDGSDAQALSAHTTRNRTGVPRSTCSGSCGTCARIPSGSAIDRVDGCRDPPWDRPCGDTPGSAGSPACRGSP